MFPFSKLEGYDYILSICKVTNLSISLQDKQLAHLAHFLTGRYPPNARTLYWTPSKTVNVIVCDVYCDPMRCSWTKVQDLSSLTQLCSSGHASNDVKMRLFLVEDMTAPVVELLGAAFHCHPQVFEEHMQTIGRRRNSDFDAQGRVKRSLSEVVVSSFNTGAPFPTSNYKKSSHFSLPFCRSFEYGSEEAQKAHEAKRTMWRKYDEEETRLEERVSGVVYTPAHLNHKVG